MPLCRRRAACRWPSTGRFVATLDGRDQTGMFGLGWATELADIPEHGRLRQRDDHSGGSSGYFVEQANGDYLDTDGGYGALTQSGGVYTFTATSGTQYVFLPNGQLTTSKTPTATGSRWATMPRISSSA